jgi:hypothetical protein
LIGGSVASNREISSYVLLQTMSGQDVTEKTIFRDSGAEAIPGVIFMTGQSYQTKEIFNWMRSKSV